MEKIGSSRNVIAKKNAEDHLDEPHNILLKADRRRKLLTTIRLRHFGHVMRKEEMEELFVTVQEE